MTILPLLPSFFLSYFLAITNFFTTMRVELWNKSLQLCIPVRSRSKWNFGTTRCSSRCSVCAQTSLLNIWTKLSRLQFIGIHSPAFVSRVVWFLSVLPVGTQRTKFETFLENLKPIIRNGSDELGLPPLDPFNLKRLPIKINENTVKYVSSRLLQLLKFTSRRVIHTFASWRRS